MTTDQNDYTYTPGKVASTLGVSTQTIRGMANKGYFSYIVLPGGERRYSASEVNALVQEPVPREVPPPGSSEREGKAELVLRLVVRDYFHGDANAAMKTLAYIRKWPKVV
jgi:hypothetical protein